MLRAAPRLKQRAQGKKNFIAHLFYLFIYFIFYRRLHFASLWPT